MSCTGDQTLAVEFPIEQQRVVLSSTCVHLRAEVTYEKLQFLWSEDGETWQLIDCELDYSLISDEAGKGEGANFTGAFVGMCCQDISGTRLPADFDYFTYEPTVG